MKKLIFFSLFFLASCATFENIDYGLSQLKGQPVDRLISIIGYPDYDRTIAGRRLLVWNTNQNVTVTTPVTTYNTGSANVYGSGGYGYGTYSGTSTTYVPTTVNYNCTITVEVDRRMRIVRHEVEGNIGGCERYASALSAVLGEAPQ